MICPLACFANDKRNTENTEETQRFTERGKREEE
jgi:hypothetical protein